MWNLQKRKEFLEEAARRGMVPGLENMVRLMAELGDVQEELTLIHVAGTNGKGSVCAMLEQILGLGGYRTGRYSSPQVFSYEERFSVEGKPIEPEELTEIFQKVAQAVERLVEKGVKPPTLFELETAAAFLLFYRKKCDVALLETGMGGRLDATNIIRKPLCSLITSVGRDHMKFLGEDLAEIAREKAGIIKAGCPVVCAPQQEEVEQVLLEACSQAGSSLRRADAGAISGVRYMPFGEDLRLQFDYKGYEGLTLSLLGACQPENAACVVEAVELLKEKGFSLTEEKLRRGLLKARWPGRFEVVCREPLTVLDGAHNEDGAKKLRETLEIGFTNRAIIYIIGVLADKEYEKILRIMLPLAECVLTVTPEDPRALSGETLCRQAAQYHPYAVYAASHKEAWIKAKERARVLRGAGAEPMILVFGSLSYLGSMKQLITGSDENGR